ncbi:MAG: arylsulfatase [Angelakisella sp.]
MASRPNIVIILADDMGYSDIGCLGGEIDTPSIDRLAAGGQCYTQFYNTARCCPTRASLLTGLHPHQTGIGHMTNTPVDRMSYDKGLFGYRGFLNRHCATIPEVLKPAGYHTYMSGKWHVGIHEADQWPTARGFERFYGIHAGACNYMRPTAPNGLFLQDTPVLPQNDYYSTDAFTDYAIRFVDEQRDDKPFFLYLAYNAPHWPLQAPKGLVEKYRGRYMQGWEMLRHERYARMTEKGIISPESCLLSPPDGDIPKWESLSCEQQVEMDYRMATYAAQVEQMDTNIGRLTDYLMQKGVLDDTLILFLSDNGGCGEGGMLGSGSVEDINSPDLSSLIVSYGKAWANLSNTPFRMYKRYIHEGGMSTPLIAHYPNGITCGGTVHQTGYLLDIMPTLLELAGASYPEKNFGCTLPDLEGISLVPVMQTGTRVGHEFMYWEHEDHCGIRHGSYKGLRDYSTGQWELYDLSVDRSELVNIAQQHPDEVALLDEQWRHWASTHFVSPKAGEAAVQ